MIRTVALSCSSDGRARPRDDLSSRRRLGSYCVPMAHVEGHAGHQAVAALAQFGVDVMFTLNGGHIWPFYEAARERSTRIVDTRHEATATFAAEGYAKLTRKPGLAVLTAGPGVT